MTRCPCSMTGLEMLQEAIAIARPRKSLLIVDRGNGWDVTMFGPDSAGRPRDGAEPDCITLQATVEQVEAMLVNLRRQSDIETVGGEMLTGEAMVRELGGKR